LASLSTLLLIAGGALALSGCQRDASDSSPMDAQMSASAAAFTADQQAWRDQRQAALLQPEGWTSLIGLHWIDPGPHFLGSAADNGVRLTMGPEHLGMLDVSKDGLRFVPDRRAAVTLDGVALNASATLRGDDDAAGPSKLGFDDGKGVATVIKRGTRYALRVRHADAPTRTGFGGIDYWPAEAQWQIPGRFIAHPPGRTIEIANIIGTTDAMPNPGVVEFEHDGATHRIEALDEGEATLFLVFADHTNGQGSYGAGRFLDIARPDAQGRVMLDFNRAYNPPCAFSAFATCPLPPPENRLELAITAGEKSYARPSP
jgi:uncharacterized protein (DUF1684 family)